MLLILQTFLLLHYQALKDEKLAERDVLVLAAYLNQAMCCLKLNEFNITKDHCLKALELDPKNEKGLFRLGQVFDGFRFNFDNLNYTSKQTIHFPMKQKQIRVTVSNCIN